MTWWRCYQKWSHRCDDNLIRGPTTPTRCLITDLRTWLKAFPNKYCRGVTEEREPYVNRWVYMMLIIWPEEKYAEGAWVCYDAAYCQ